MAMKTWKAKVKVGKSGSVTEVQIQANSSADARNLLEAQYGKGCIFISPTEVR